MTQGKLKVCLLAEFDSTLISNSCVSLVCISGIEGVSLYLEPKVSSNNNLASQYSLLLPKPGLTNMQVFDLTVGIFRFLKFNLKSLSHSTTQSAYQ
jgi:hypothetical protein